MVVPRFLDLEAALPIAHLGKPMDMCSAASADLFFETEAVDRLLLPVLGGEAFSFDECGADRPFADEDCPFFAEEGEPSLAGF
jgi:hypothetical protein